VFGLLAVESGVDAVESGVDAVASGLTELVVVFGLVAFADIKKRTRRV
jgi:acetyl-CoA acetyltransferase